MFFFNLQLVFLFNVAFQARSGLSLKVVDESGAAYNTDCCRAKAEQYTKKAAEESRKSNDASISYCAVLFENDDCDSCTRIFSGWDEGIKAGKRTFGKASRYREDSASVIVAPGCILVGYDEDDVKDNVKRTIATAIGRKDWVYKQFGVGYIFR